MASFDQLKQTFFDECAEGMQLIEQGLSDMREGLGSDDTVNAVFRAVHSVKGGAGIFGVEFFVTKTEVIFSELSPRPHDTGMVTMISQNLTQFDLHCRAVLGLPVPEPILHGPSASAVILADRNADTFDFEVDPAALKQAGTDVRLFGKPTTRPYRRMGVALARGADTDAARATALKVAQSVTIRYR